MILLLLDLKMVEFQVMLDQYHKLGEYGNIYASKLGNGIYQIANGHHRIAALRQLGYNSVKFFLVP